MDLNALFYGLGISGLFASRAFLPAFITAAVLRWGDNFTDLPIIGELLSKVNFLDAIGSEPTWFTNGYVITALGLFAALEIAATKIPEAEEALESVNKYLKTGMMAATYFGFVSTTDAEFLNENMLIQAGIMANFWGLLGMANTYVMSSIRGSLLEILFDADDGDDLGARNLIAWAEDGWVIVGFIWLIVYPAAVLLILGIVFGFFFLIKKYLNYKEEKSKIECAECNTSLYPCATECYSCHTPVPSPVKIGMFGQPKDEAAGDVEKLKFRLVEKKRCPVCATRFEERSTIQSCETCGHKPFENSEWVSDYITRITLRLPIVLLICFGLSFIPFLGLVIGVLYYRVQIVAPFRRYIPWHRSFFVKWLVRFVFFILIAVQLIPGAGGFVVPVMALLSYLAYKRSFKKSLPSAA